MLQAQLADVYRLQMYSSSALDRLQSPLPSDTYGASPRTHCANVLRYNSVFSQSHGVGKGDTLPLLYDEDPEDHSDNAEAAAAVGVKPVGKPTAGVGICGHKSTVKKTLGNVFYTAYCKHWSKLTKTASSTRGGAPLIAQQDMCDAFCFYQWAVALLTQPPVAAVGDNSEAIASVQNALRKVVQYHSIPEPVSSRHLPIASLRSVDEDEEEAAKLSSNSGGNHHHHHHGNVSVLCLDSSWCNWSNQPSMYKKDWYLKNIGVPCEDTPEGRGFCIGSPGRQSAVRQELFFVKRREHWAKKQHKICISSGAFIHHEVDNRE
ncbi:Hypothetical protein, putative [Bodo saltans]|uniref:Uncharacterized protein n=1 Tax=Bodo saltans TaxID=75058 RepID=A0A0S4IQ14_BODSA|nr:Hypothetical protein, putative [Bodo saltans]|eukprot:CUF91829.1 Hypothetical protein, putative [Bodo saltans]